MRPSFSNYLRTRGPGLRIPPRPMPMIKLLASLAVGEAWLGLIDLARFLVIFFRSPNAPATWLIGHFRLRAGLHAPCRIWNSF